MYFRLKSSMHAVAGLAILGVAAVVPAANAAVSTSCVTSNPYQQLGAGPNLAAIPIGCDASNHGVPIVFTDGPSTLTISDFVILQTQTQKDNFALDGTFNATPFSFLVAATINDQIIANPSLGNVVGTSQSGTISNLLLNLSSYIPDAELRIDPNTTNTYTQLVTSLGGGLYDSSLTLNFTLDLSLDNGSTWVAEDPMLTSEAFNPAEYPNLAPLLGVPEPDTLALFGAGLLGWGFLRRRAVKIART